MEKKQNTTDIVSSGHALINDISTKLNVSKNLPSQQQSFSQNTNQYALPGTPRANLHPTPPSNKRPSSKILRFALASGVLLAVIVAGFIMFTQKKPSTDASVSELTSSNFHPLEIPLDQFVKSGQLSIDGTQTLTINGQLRANNSLIITPTSQPTDAIVGQLYYDQTSNQLRYFNGNTFSDIATNNTPTVKTIGGQTGNIAVGSGLNVSGGAINNTGVLSVQGQAGAVSFTNGGGIAVNGTTLTNTGLLSLGGQSGNIAIGSGLQVTNGTLSSSGVQSITPGSANLLVSNDGAGNITITSIGGGSATVSSPGGTAGQLAYFTGAQTIANSLVSESGSTVTITGNLTVTGSLALSTPLAVASGGTGAATASGARTGIGAAASGANSDITSLSGLTTALSVLQGGTGVGTLATNGVVIGQGTSALTSLVAGSANECLMSTSGAPAWQTCPGATGVTSVNGVGGVIAIANATAAGSTITINDATTASKGIASFNSTNFTATGGAINTIQNISITSTPTFAGVNTNSITPSGALTIGSSGQNATLQGALVNVSSTSGANTTTLSFVTPTATVGYRLQTAAAGTYDICTTVGNCVGVGGGVTSSGGTTNQIAKFTGSQAIGNSLLSDNGTVVTVSGNLSVTGSTTLGTALSVTNGGTGATTGATARSNLGAAASGVNSDITSLGGLTTALSVGQGGTGSATASGARSNLGAAASGTNSDITSLSGLTTALNVLQGGTGVTSLTTNGVIIGQGTGALTSVATGTSGQCLISTAGAPAWQTCPGSGGVTSVNGQTGVISLANATASGGVITINDATASAKGIASFNSTNLTVTSGSVNTVQNINTTATPTFGTLTLTSSQATNPMFLVNNTNTGATGNLLDLQVNGSSKLSVAPSGSLTLVGTINGQTISSAANFTGTLGVSGLASLNGGAAVTGTLTANTITPTGALTLGSTGQSATLQGAAVSITSTSGASTAALSFVAPTANVTYRLQTAAAGTYDVCTTAGNCAGVGGGVTTPGGTTNQLAKFTSSQAIGNSIISDNGSTVTIAGGLAVNTITPSTAMTIGALGQNLTLQGAAVSLSATSSGITNTLTFAAPTTSGKTITLPNASGTVAVSASGPLQVDANGNISCPSCLTSGGSGGGTAAVDSVDTLVGALTLANSVGSGTTITINNASTSQLGLAEFNSTNFTTSGGIANTIQDINTTAAPTFGRLSVTSSQATNDMFVVNNTNASGTGKLLNVELNGAGRFTVDTSGNVLSNGTINGQTIGSTTSLTGSLAVAGAANLNGGATVSGTLTANTITPTAAMVVGSSSQNLTLQGASTNLTSTSGANTTTLSLQTPTANVAYRLLTAAAGTYDICTTVGNCAGIGGGVTVSSSGTANTLAMFTGGQTIANSIYSQNAGATAATIGGNLTVTGTTTLNTALSVANGGTGATAASGARTNLGAAASGANSDITSLSGLTTALSVGQGGTGATSLTTNGVIVGNGTGALSSIAAGGSNLCLVSTAGAPTWATCPGISSLDTLTGALTIANSTGSGSTVTINSATTSQLGLASFNSNNFTVTSGAVNTIQDINTTAAPSFGALTLTSSQATSPMLLVNNTNTSGSGNLLDLQLGGSSKLSVAPTGNLTLVGTVNGQTISSTANFTGSVTVAGAANLNGGASVTGTLTANTITPTSALTIGSSAQQATLQGSAASVITATSGASTTTIGFVAPTANVTYQFQTAAAGTYSICSTAGNCAGVGGGVTTSGGTANTIAKFSASQGITNSGITDDGTTVGTSELLNQTYSGTTGSGATFGVTNGASSGATTLKGVSINLTGTNNASGSNTNTGLNFGNVTAATNNTFNGIAFGTGYTNLVSYNSTALISGAGLIQNAALDATLTYSNIQKVGALTVGSIASGFGTISTGNNITTTATLQGGTGVFTGANSITLGTASTNTGSIVFKGSGGTGSLTLAGPTTPNTGNFTLTLPSITANANVCTDNSICAGYAASSGSSNYIHNQTTSQSSANFDIQGATGSVVGVLEAATTTPADILDLQNNSGVNVASFGATGLTTFKASTTSSSAFVVQGTGGSGILSVDNSANQVVLGTASSLGGKLVFNNASNANTITIQAATTGSGNGTLTLPNETGTLCSTSNSSACNLQTEYFSSTGGSNTTPTIKLSNTIADINIQDSDTGLGGNFLSLRSKNAAGLGNIVFGFAVQGQLFEKPTTDNANVVQIENNAGKTLFDIDTSGGYINIGTTGGATGGTGSAFNGTTTNIEDSPNANTTTIIGSTAQNSGTATIDIGYTNTAGGGSVVNIGSGPSASSGSTIVQSNTSLTLNGSSSVAINSSINAGTTINGGTSTGTVGIGNSAAGALTLQSASTIGITTTNFNVSTLGVETLAGAQTADITTAAAATSNGITILPGTSSGATTTGASVTVQGGAASGTTTVTAGSVTIQGGNATGASGSRTGGNVNIDAGTGATSNGVVNIGNNNATTIQIGQNGSPNPHIKIDSGTGTIDIGAGANARSVNIATGGAAQNVQIGSSSSTSSLSLQGGTNGINIGTSATSETIKIGNTSGAVAQTINIGINGTASSTDTITMGSLIGTSATTIQAGSGNINLNVNQSGAGVVIQTATNNSANAFKILDSGANTAVVVSTNNVATGANAANSTLVVAKDSGTGRSINAAGTINASGADYAEYFNQVVPGALQAGDAVCLSSSQQAEACTRSNTNAQLIGAVSTHPGYVGNDIFDPAHPDRTILVGLLGQIRVKVSTANGPIHSGDMLALSDEPGVVVKAINPGISLGSALEDFTTAGEGMINVYIHVGYYAPTDTSTLQQTNGSYLQNGSAATFASLNVNGVTTLSDLTVKGTATINNLVVADTITTTTLMVNGHIITAGGSPTITGDISACSSPNVSLSGTDTAGLITVTTGSGCMGLDGRIAAVLFNKAFGAPPRIMLSPGNAQAATLSAYINSTTVKTTGFDVDIVGNGLKNGTTYTWYYQVMQ